MPTDLFGNPLPPQKPAKKPATCGDCLYCKTEGPHFLCRCPSSWGVLAAFAFRVNPALPPCTDYKPRPRQRA